MRIVPGPLGFGITTAGERGDTEDDRDLLTIDFDPPDQALDDLSPGMPIQCVKALANSGRKVLESADDQGQFAFGLSRPDEYRLTFLTKIIGSPGPGRVCETIEAADRSFAFLEQGITQLMQEGTFAPGSTHLAAEAVWACLHGVTSLLLDRAEHIQSDPDALMDAVIEMTLHGLRACSQR